MREECDFGTLRDIIIPPYAISIPRIADLNKDLILGIGNNMSKPTHNIISPSSNSATVGLEYSITLPSDYRTGGTISKC